jgi:hypothetical protein
MQEIAVLIVKFKDNKKPDEYINTELSLNEIYKAIHFLEERKRKNVKGGRSKKVEKWVQRILTIKHYLTFQELDLAYKNREIGRDSYYRIYRELKSYGYNRKYLDILYEFTQIIRKFLYLIVNHGKFQEAKAIFIKASQTL